MVKNYNPVIVFSFSKRECEANALAMSKFEFNNTDEQDLVANIFNNAIENLSSDDRQLPQISNLLPLLRRGIGIHHSGLLPILKEVIEILFQEGIDTGNHFLSVHNAGLCDSKRSGMAFGPAANL